MDSLASSAIRGSAIATLLFSVNYMLPAEHRPLDRDMKAFMILTGGLITGEALFKMGKEYYKQEAGKKKA